MRRDRDSHEPKDSRYSNDSIPFRDADPTIGEIPLDELDTFVVAARDERGVSIQVTLHMPPYMERQIEVILRSGRFPYLRKADFIRHAIYRHIYWTVGIRHNIPKHILPGLDAVLEVCRDEEINMRMEEVFFKIDDRVNGHMAKGDHAEVIRMLNSIKNRMGEIGDSPWMRRYKAHFIARWGPYLMARAGEMDKGVM